MRILHLSDLHLTGDIKSLETAWHSPSAALKSGDPDPVIFDAIIVSGDLSQEAGAEEYVHLREFVDGTLLDLVRDRQRRRIVFVPGNHDVQWGATVSKKAPLSKVRKDLKQQDVSRIVRDKRVQPGSSDWRHRITSGGDLEFRKVDRDRYGRRFDNVQHFLEGFYQKELRDEPHRMFALNHPDEAEHWSAHVFEEERIAIYGFSSCQNNDRDWTGAQISEKAIAEATRHANRFAREKLRVAVWHHGLITEQGRPDHLPLLGLGALYDAGFRIGIHGHTHAAAADTLERFFHEQFLVIGTGSLGAGSPERPDAVGNQFSVLRLGTQWVDVQVYERDGLIGSYQRRPGKSYPIGLRNRTSTALTVAKSHRRIWNIRTDNGIADATVELKDLELNEPTRLAIVAPPFVGISADEDVEGAPALKVTGERLEDGRARYILSGAPGHYSTCTWHYSVSNAFALHRADVKNMPANRGMSVPKDVKDDEEGRSHVVRLRSRKLVLKYRFDSPGAVAARGSGHVIVERRVTDHGDDRWQRVPEEEARCARYIRAEPREVELSLPDPVHGLRYTPVFQLAQAGPTPDSAATRAARTILERVRKEIVPAEAAASTGEQNALSARFTRLFEPQLQSVLVGKPTEDSRWLGEHSAWLGMIWHDERRMVFPAFGRFPTASWSVRFSAGHGVAGQAFRFGAPAAWCKGKPSLIYVNSTEVGGPFQSEYEWIVALPIQVPGRAPVGVVSFAGVEHQSQAAAKLYELAEQIVSRGERVPESGRSQPPVLLANKLQSVIAACFWRAAAKELTHEAREKANAILKKLQRPKKRSTRKK